MKKYMFFGYLILIVVLGGFMYFAIKSVDKGDRDIDEKIAVEIKYIESKAVQMINLMNNINDEKYILSTIEMDKQDKEEAQNEEVVTIYELLQKENELEDVVEWEKLEKIIDEIYISIPVFTLDLYEAGVKNQTVIDFNRSLDEVKVSITSADRILTLVNLVKMYDALRQVVEDVSDNYLEKILFKTKLDVFLAYAKLEEESYDEMEKHVSDAVNEFNNLYSQYEMLETKNIAVNKTFVALNELKVCVDLNNKELFLFKYKCLMDEMAKV